MIYWLLLGASILHVVEESIFDFVGFVRAHSPVKDVTMTQFVVINTLFLMLMLFAAIWGGRYPVLVLSGTALVFINAWFHIFPALWMRRYTPGLVTAVALYLPLSTWTYRKIWLMGHDVSVLRVSFLMGLGWMLVPLIYQGLLWLQKKRRFQS